MCHPTVGDLLFGRSDRVFPRVCVRSWMRIGGDVFGLSGRIQGCRPGHGPAVPSGAPSQYASAVREIRETLNYKQFGTSRQHGTRTRVEANKLARCLSPAFRLADNLMTKGSGNPDLRRPPVQHSGAAESVCADRAPLTSPSCAASSTAARAMISAFPTAAGSIPCSRGPFSTQSFRRYLRSNAGGEQISTGVPRTVTEVVVSRTSVIVLVTSEGTVAVRAN